MLGSNRRGVKCNNNNTMTTPWFPVPNSNYNFIVDPPRLVGYIYTFM